MPQEQKVLVENSDWSGRHVRLKYQMIVSALALYLIVCTKISGLNLFGIILYEKEFPKELFTWALFSFSLFSILAFVLRSLFESSRWSSLRKDISNLVSNIRENELLMQDVFDFEENKAFAAELLSTIEEPNDEFGDEFYTKFQKLNFEVREGKLWQLNFSLSEINNDLKNLRDSLEHIRPGYHPKVTAYENSLRKVSNAVSYIMSSAENVERDLKEISSGRSRHKDIVQNIIRHKNAVDDVGENLPKLIPSSQLIMRGENVRRLIYWTQNVGFSVVLPVLTAISLIIFSIINKFSALVSS